MKSSGRVVRFALAAVAMLASPAAAQERQDGEAPELDDVVVTAQRRPQLQVQTPLALAVLRSEELEQRRVLGVSDLAAFVPGLTYQTKSPTSSIVVLRGVSNADGSSFQEPRVSVFQDGAPVSKSHGAFVELFDMEAIEVSRGPQTTLFGQSALTGAINMIQRKAEERSLLGMLLEAGSRDHSLFEGVVNAPVMEGLSLRLAGRLREEGGLNADLLAGGRFSSLRSEATRATLSWRPTKTLTSHLILNLEHTQGSGQSYKSKTFLPADPGTGAVLGSLAPHTGAALMAGQGFDGGRSLGHDRRVESLAWLTSWKLNPALTVSSTSAARRFQSYEAYDQDGFAFPLLTVADDAFGDQFSQELRLNLEPSSAFSLVLGASYLKADGAQRIPLQIDERLVVALLTGRLDRRTPVLSPLDTYTNAEIQSALLLGLARARGAAIDPAQALAIARNLQTAHREVYTDTSETEGSDLFFDLGWKPTPRVQVFAGFRYGWSDRRSGLSSDVEGRSVLAGYLAALGQPEAQRRGLLAALAAPGAATRPPSAAYPVPRFGLRAQPTPQGEVQTQVLADAGAAWRLVGQYALTPVAMVYASYARGRRPQVLAPDTPGRPEGDVVFNRVSAETMDSVEVGAKRRWPAAGLSLDLATYYYAYRNFQTVIQQGATYTVADAGRAASWGAEADLRWSVSGRIDIFGVLEASRARFQEGLYRGNRLALNSDFKSTLGANLRFPATGGELRVTPTFAWRSGFFFSDDNGKPELLSAAFLAPLDYQARQEGVGVLDVNLDYSSDRGGWSIGAFARNLLDVRYLADAGNGGEDFGLPTYTGAERRQLGVRLSVRR